MASQSTTKGELNPSITAAWQKIPDVAVRYKAAENATRPFAAIMVEKAGLATTINKEPANIFDLACGTGAVEAEIYDAVEQEKWSDIKILAGDISQPMLDYLVERKESEGWSGVETKIVDGSKLDSSTVEDDKKFSHIFVGFAIFVLPADTLKKLVLQLRPGGFLAVATWANLPWYPLLKRTYAMMPSRPQIPSEEQLWASFTSGMDWHTASFVSAQLQEAGLQKVENVQKKLNIDCGTPDTFMTTMGFMLGMLSMQWDEEVREQRLKEVQETMRSIVIEEAGGVDKHAFMDFEGIVGFGWKAT